MKKFLSILTLLLAVCSGAWADTETPGNAGTSDTDLTGNSYSIPGTYIAGAGSIKVGDMATKGVKIRLNKESNTLVINVKSGYEISSLTIYAVTNDNSKDNNITSITVDGGSNLLASNINIPNKKSSSCATVNVSQTASSNITLTFSMGSNEASQGNFDFHFTYAKTGNDPGLSVSPASVTLAIDGTQQISASATSSGTISYSSDNPSVATVSSSGLITAKAVGNAVITTSVAATSSYGVDSKTTNVTVKSVEPTLTKTAQLDNADHVSAQNYFTVENPGDYNTKYTGTYGGTSYTSGLKMLSDTQVKFTNTVACDLVIVQSIASANYLTLVKVDGDTFASDYTDKYYYDDATNKVRVYTIKNIDAGEHAITRNSEIGLLYIGVTEPDTKVATPVITPADGATFSGASQEVTISCTTAGATIYYTTDGSEPTTSSTEYSAAFNISASTTVKAFAVKSNLENSSIASATITKVVPAVTSSWDFTNWSDATKNGVKADTEAWSENEKKTASEGIVFGENGRSNKSAISAGSSLQFGTTNIEETDGLTFSVGEYGLGLMFNLPKATVSNTEYTYNGSQFLWLYSKNSIITIPSVPAGATIEIGVESHNGGSDRGVTLKNGSTTLTQTQGEATSTTYQECKWTNATAGDVTVTPSSGLHIYYITITANVETVPVTTDCEGGLATFASAKALDLANLPEGVEAYKVTTASNTSAKLEKVTVAVPAGTGLIFKGTKGATYNIPVAASASELSDNLLIGVTAVDGYTVADGEAYALSKTDGLLHPVSEGLTIPAGKAYLEASNFAGARTISLVFEDEATGISTIDNRQQTRINEVYNLRGQRVAQPTRGLYIVNGKKVLVK